MTHPTGLGPRPPVCACESTIRAGVVAGARLAGLEVPAFGSACETPPSPECDRVALARALALVCDPRPILTDACLAPQIVERDATIRGLTDRLVDRTSSLRRAEWALGEALERIRLLVKRL